jgi:hypothetical protein
MKKHSTPALDRIRTSGKSYDERQTLVCDTLRLFLQSIAITAVHAQDQIGSPDTCADSIESIAFDVTAATTLASALSTNDF